MIFLGKAMVSGFDSPVKTNPLSTPRLRSSFGSSEGGSSDHPEGDETQGVGGFLKVDPQ